MFDKNTNKVVVVHYGNVNLCPPVINLVECLLNNDVRVHLISGMVSKTPEFVRRNQKFTYSDLGDMKTNSSMLHKIANRMKLKKEIVQEFNKNIKEGDVVWTTNETAVMTLSKNLLPYQDRHVLQLMELIDFCPIYYKSSLLKFPIEEFARKAWKTVVPEENRAYIQQINWKQEKKPYILPNKPYYLDPGEETEDVKKAMDFFKTENRKIIMYLGIFGLDRDMESFIKAVDILGDEYCLVAIGRISDLMKDRVKTAIENTNNFKYLGFFNPPKHLNFLKYAHIGLTPYKPSHDIKYASPLNSLFCAPNKVFEYAGYGVPMLGTDVLGLKVPFEKYNIGVCCEELTVEAIINGIKTIESQYDEMSKNCQQYFDSVDLDVIVNNILFD